MPLPMPPPPMPMTLGSSDHLGVLMNPGGYLRGGRPILPHFSFVMPPLDPGLWCSKWCPGELNVINLTLPVSDGQALACGQRVRPCMVEHFAQEQHSRRTSYGSVAAGVYKQVILKWPAFVEVVEPDPHMAPDFKPALRVHVQPPSDSSFDIDIFFTGMGTHEIEVQPSRTDPWRTTGRVLSSGQGGLWAVKLVGGLPPTLVDGLVPCPLSLYHFGGML